MQTSRKLVVFTLVALALWASGCGQPAGVNSPETFDLGALEEVGDLYNSVSNANKKPPASLKDLARNRDIFLVGYNAIAKGDVIVFWGVNVTPGADSTASDEILAYKSEVPTSGGAVLMKNLAARKMTADEFKAAPKPPGPTSAPAAGKGAEKG